MFGPFKATDSLLARVVRKLKLTTKQAHKGYYKGTRSGNVGRFSYNPRHPSVYLIQYEKVRTFVLPKDMETSQLTPFVSKKIRRPMGGNKKYTGKMLLDQVKEAQTEIEAR